MRKIKKFYQQIYVYNKEIFIIAARHLFFRVYLNKKK